MAQVQALLPLLLLLASAPAASEPRQQKCAAVRSAIGGRFCAETGQGIAIASSQRRAELLATIAIAGERRFALRFGQAVPRFAVVEVQAGKVDAALDTDLKRAGFLWRLPWLSEGATADAYRSSITRAVEAKAQAMHLDQAQTAQLVSAALAQQASLLDPAALQAKEASALPHELGHGWFIKAFWPDATAASSDHYGGPAPDWMDETAAVLMEDDRLADRRREQFAAIYRGQDAAARARIVDLATFLSGGHPALPKINLPAGAGGVTVLTGAEAAGIAAAAGGFYLQSRMFADYVLDRSGDQAAFRNAASSFAKAQTTPEWLAVHGRDLRLPTTLPALQQDWDVWLKTRLGASAA